VFLAVVVATFAAVAAWAADDTASPPAAAPAQEQKAAAPAAPKEAAPPPSVTIIEATDAHGVLGRDVRSPTDEDMGRIVDVIVDSRQLFVAGD